MAINPHGLLMIEPEGEATEPLEDDLTRLARVVYSKADYDRRVRYRGWHTCICGVKSDNRAWSVGGWETNALMVHYIARHRDEVPQSEIDKLKEIASQL